MVTKKSHIITSVHGGPFKLFFASLSQLGDSLWYGIEHLLLSAGKRNGGGVRSSIARRHDPVVPPISSVTFKTTWLSLIPGLFRLLLFVGIAILMFALAILVIMDN